MVLNLCLPHFHTSVQCNKLCADGHDVSNLLSGDPIARRRGFKLEYFLRPPVHVTLSFPVCVDLCRLDLELFPSGTDPGRGSCRIEILVCSDRDGVRFQLVSRSDLQEELRVCFLNPAFKPRDPFPDLPPAPESAAKAVNLWSRGSLVSVAHLRISVPFSKGCVLGIKSLSVWASPSRSCPAFELEKILDAHLNSVKRTNRTIAAPPKPTGNIADDIPIPEEFLDPLTQELMVFPMILPSGVIIDNSTLEEYWKREATWGRLPNDPFTGVPFSQSSKPLPNPLLKSRIDRLALRRGCTGVGSRSDPQPSRLAEVKTATDSSRNTQTLRFHGSTSRSAKRKYDSSFPSTSADPGRPPLRKTLQTHSESDSHERRLADSLDQALDAALHGLPVFTSPRVDASTGQHACVYCSCSLSVYSSSVPSYALPCAHLACGPCLRRKRPRDSQTPEITCPTCGTSASGGDVTRVHH
ncbi:RING finger protein 37 [Pimephales promelas]|uniref:RING finger protein 37 n=1 Tax=Pimephales promelas TaxID=90988 RepID=UPI0019554979|nr:RING finger protein 37 [Pimephales promelas]KAG1930284.1 RING finger protein [Pimephales promelas]